VTRTNQSPSDNVKQFLEMDRPWENDPDAAYRRAQKVIAQTRELGEKSLSFSMLKTLRDLPPEIASLDALQVLNLSGTGIGNKDLAHLSGLRGLRVLKLDWCEIDDEGLAHLSGLTQLQELILYGTKVSDAGLLHLKDMSELQELDLERCEGICDLRPLLGIGRFSNPLPEIEYGVFFDATPAARAAHLSDISAMESYEEMTEALFTRLDELPRWPEPLPMREGG